MRADRPPEPAGVGVVSEHGRESAPRGQPEEARQEPAGEAFGQEGEEGREVQAGLGELVQKLRRFAAVVLDSAPGNRRRQRVLGVTAWSFGCWGRWRWSTT